MIVEFFLYIPGLSTCAGSVFLQLNKTEQALIQKKDLHEDIFGTKVEILQRQIEYCYVIRKYEKEQRCNPIERIIFSQSNYYNYEKTVSQIQFFDTPEKFEEIKLLMNRTTLKQTDIKNSLLMFAQTNSNPEMLRNLIKFIKTSSFKNEKELLIKLSEKVFRHVNELLNNELFEDVLNKFTIFKNDWCCSQLIESSQILWTIRQKAPQLLQKRVNQEIEEMKGRFSLVQLLKELSNTKSLFSEQDLPTEVAQRIYEAQYSYELIKIQEEVNNTQLEMSDKALALFQQPLRLFWERNWQFQIREAPQKSLQFLMQFKMQMKEIILENPDSLRKLFAFSSNSYHYQFEDFFLILLNNISEYLNFFDPTGESVTILFKKPMTKIQTKQLFLEILRNKVILKVNIKELCHFIADSFNNLNEIIQFYTIVKQHYQDVDLSECMLLSFNTLVNQLPPGKLFIAIGFISPFTKLNEKLQIISDEGAQLADQMSFGNEMRKILAKKFSQVPLSDLLEGMNNMKQLEDCQEYFQIIILSFRSAAQQDEKNGKDLFDLLKQILYRKNLVKYQKSRFEVQILDAAIQEIQNIILEKYSALRETGDHLSSPYTLKMIQSIDKSSQIRAQVFTDIKTFVEHIQKIDILTIQNKIIKSKELQLIFQQFSEELKLDFSSFMKQHQEIISTYNLERQKLNYFFVRFGEYLVLEKAEFEKICQENVLLGEAYCILGHFNHLQIIYNFYYHLRESKIFLNVVFFFEQKSLQKKSLHTLNTILYETKNALIQFIFLIINIQSNLSNFDDAYLSILSQYKIEQVEEKVLEDEYQEQVAIHVDECKMFQKGILNLQILRDLAGQSFTVIKENVQSLFALVPISFNDIISNTIQSISKVQFVQQQSQTIMNLAMHFQLPESKENTDFMAFLSTFQNPLNKFEEQPINVLMSFEKGCDFNLGQNFAGKLPIDKELQKIEQLHEILEYSQKNLLNGSFLDMRDLIDDDDTESMSLIIKLDSLKPLLNALQQLKRGYEQQKKLNPYFPIFSQLIKDLIETTRYYLNSAEIVSNVEECSRNFFKISQVSQSFEKKKSFITLTREIVKEGSYSFSLSSNNYRNVEIFVECPKKKYTEFEIRQVCSRVILEQKTNTSIAASGEQKISDAKKLHGLASVEQRNDYDFEGQEQRKEQALKQLDNDIDLFKEQWFQAEQLKDVFFQLISFGNFQVLEQNRIYSNKNNSFNKTFQLMKEDYKRFLNELESWKEQIQQIFSIYPSFSLVGFRHYKQLSQYVVGKIQTITYDLRQILHTLGNQDDKISLIPQLFKPQQESQGASGVLLQKIASMICDNFEYPAKIPGQQLLQNQDKRDFILKLFFPGVREIIQYLVSKASQLSRVPKYYQYFFYNSESDLSDMEQFFYRFQFLTVPDEKLEFFLIFSTDIEQEFFCTTQELIVNCFNNSKKISPNKLKILLLSSGKQYQNFSFIPEQSLNFSNELLDGTTGFFKECNSKAAFYFSEFPGEGKTLAIQMAENSNDSQVRVPTSSSENKSVFLQSFQLNFQKINKKVQSLHIDLYESETYDLNILLFELIILRSVSHHSERLMILDPEVKIYIEIANTLQQSLIKNLFLFEVIQKIKVNFNFNSFQCDHSFQTEKQLQNNVICYKYLSALDQSGFSKDMNLGSINKFPLDSAQANPQKNTLSSQEQIVFKGFLGKFVVSIIEARGSRPCFYQLHRFIDLFGSEMMRFEKCIFLNVENVMGDLLQQGIRTKIVAMSYRLCIEISMSRSNIELMQLNQKDRKEVIMDRISKSIEPFSKCVVNFVTFQEQELSSITTFFDKESSVPESLRTLFKNYKKQMLFFDEENKPEDLLHWLILLINQNEQFMYKYQGSTVFANIAKKELRHLVKRITILKDNFFKIATLFMRIRSNTPLIIMGEAGIGKTVLVELMSKIMEANFQIMIVHTGISDQQVVDFVLNGIKLQEQNNQRVVLFFDEVNTSKMIRGLFKEILIDRCMKGIKIPESVIPIAAINPYKLKSEVQKNMLNCQIHGGIKKEMVQKIASVDLEYMVEPMPESMYSLIWNFDSLSLEDEKKYILKMVEIKNKLEIQKIKKTSSEDKIFNEKSLKNIAQTVFMCQNHIRTQMGYASACSLRDVTRFLNILFWMQKFLKICQFNNGLMDLNEFTACPCLAFYIVYCVRLPLSEQRQQFIEMCAQSMRKNLYEYNTIIQNTQQFLIDQCDVPSGIVKNSALKQNVFTLFVSIINKLPVILIGPPGSSKTQSIKILIQTMKGRHSHSPFFKNFQALIPLFYQGHLQSTSERILEVFQKAIDKQDRIERDKQSDEYLSLVYIEEIGLADISPHNPLKVLHSTLENPKVAVACISNWPLDQSKMNRMISIFRLNTTEAELIETILHIWNEFKENSDNSIQMALKTLLPYFLPGQIAKVYSVYLANLKIAQPKFEQFHGMRDFYGMVKLFCYQEAEFLKSKQKGEISKQFKLTQIDRVCFAFQRHFSGLLQSQDILKSVVSQFLYQGDQIPIFCDSLNLISTHLSEEQQSHYLPRHLMIITDNLSSSIEYLNSRFQNTQMTVKTLVGGEFSDDLSQERAFDIINEIISCVEQGTILILSNLDSIYQSLYELLNQSYRNFNGKNYCKITFGADSNNIEVSPFFKLIMVVHENEVQRLDGPLLNRFEKHFLRSSILLTEDDQLQVQSVMTYFQTASLQNFFRFNNLMEMINTLVSQKRFLQETASNSQLIQQLYHLAPIGKMIGTINPSDSSFKQKYIESNLHFDLDELIKQKIDSSQGNKDTNIHLISIATPSSFISSFTQYSPKVIYISAASSSKNLETSISDFFKDIQKGNRSELIKDPQILIIFFGQDEPLSKVRFTQQKVGETIAPLKDITKQVFVILIKQVQDNFKMIQFTGKWELFYLEDLKPLHFITDVPLLEMLSLKKWFNNLNQHIYQAIDFDYFLEYFLQIPENITTSYLKIKYKQISYGYQRQRIQQFQQIFDPKGQKQIQKQLHQFSSKIILLKLQLILKELKIHTLEQFLQEYVIQQGFIKQSQSLPNAILKAFYNLLSHSFAFFLSVLERNHLTYAFLQAPCKSNEYYSFLQTNILEILRIKGDDNLKSINQPGSSEWDFKDQFALEIESKDVFLPICHQIFEDLTGFLKRPKQSTNEIKLDITINTMMSLISEKDQKILKIFDEEASQDFIKYNGQGMSKLDIEVVNQLIPPSQNQAAISFLRVFACNSYFKKEIHMITSLLNMFYWIEDPYKLCQGYKPEEDQERNVKNYARFLLEKLFFMIQPSPDLMELAKQYSIDIATTVKFLIRFIQSIEIERDKGVLNIKQQLIILQNFLLLFTVNNQINQKLLGIVDLHKINSLDVFYIKDFKAALQTIDSKPAIEQSFLIDQLQINKALNQKSPELKKKTEKIFQDNWITFILDLLLSVVHSKQYEDFDQLCVVVVNYLSFIESDHLAQGSEIKDKMVIQINVILSEVVKKCSSEEQLFELFQKNTKDIIPQPSITSESTTIVVLSSCIQQYIVSKSLRSKKNISNFPSILAQISDPQGLNLLQKAIYLAIFREVTQISLDVIKFPNFKPFDQSITKFFGSNLPTYLEVHIAKQFYHKFKEGTLILSQQKQSQYFKDSSWLQKYATPFTGLLSSAFLTSDEVIQFQNLFSNNSSAKNAIKQLFLEELPKSNNVFGQIYRGNCYENMFYPFMMFNNIPLFHRDSQNNTQLYQCNNCKEYIFSNACPNLTSIAVCSRCKKQIIKGNSNTIQVLTHANQNPQALNNIIQTNQWMGYYIRIEEDQDAFKLDQGTSFDLRLFTIAYDLAFFYAYSQGKKYTQKKQITYFNQKSIREESSSQEEITRLLRIHFQANPLEFLEEQINYALQHISKIAKTIFNMNEEEKNIVVFKLFLTILFDQNIISSEDRNSRGALNQSISQMIEKIVQLSKSIILNKNSPLISIILEADQFQAASAHKEFKINLRTTRRDTSPDKLMDHLRLKLPNNTYLILKELLNLPKLQYASQSLKVLVKFSQLMNKHLSKMFTQKKAQEITLLEALQGDSSHPLFQFFLQELIPVWENIREQEKEFQIGCQSVTIQPIREDTKICNLVLSLDKQYGFFSNVLEILCNIQNNILEKILASAKQEKTDNNNSNILYFIEHLFEREEKEQDQEIYVKPIEQIDTDFNIIQPYNPDTLSQYITNDIAYSKGRNLLWDLDGLQKEIARQVISNTVKISLENSQMYPFLVEVTQINILNIDIPQQPLSEQQKQQLEAAFQSHEEEIDLLLKVSTLFAIFRSEKNSANLNLEQALLSIQIKIPSGKIRTLFSSSLQLRHINGVIQVLENRNMEQLIEGCNPIYRQEIFRYQLQKTMDFLTKTNILQNFSNALGRFIIRCLCQNQVAINEKSKLFIQLFDEMTYEEFWDDPSVLNQLYQQASKDETKIGQAYALFHETKKAIKMKKQQQYLKQNASQQLSSQKDNSGMLMDSFTDKANNLGQNLKQK